MPSTIGDNVRRLREKAGLSPQQLATLVGVRLFTIQQIESGVTRKSKYLPDIARVLGTPLAAVDPSQTPTPETMVASPIEPAQLVSSRDLPIYASVDAGDGQLVMTNAAVDLADRPNNLAHVRDAYGIIVSGSSMVPIVRPGDTIVIHPHRPPRRDDLCVFRSQGDGEFRAVLKEFVGETHDGWRVRRYHPKEIEYVLKKRDWGECHVVVAIYRR